MVAFLVITLAIAAIALVANWLVHFTGNTDFDGRYTKYQEKADELSRTLSLTYVCCKMPGCRHANDKGKCQRRSIAIDADGRCKDYEPAEKK